MNPLVFIPGSPTLPEAAAAPTAACGPVNSQAITVGKSAALLGMIGGRPCRPVSTAPTASQALWTTELSHLLLAKTASVLAHWLLEVGPMQKSQGEHSARRIHGSGASGPGGSAIDRLLLCVGHRPKRKSELLAARAT